MTLFVAISITSIIISTLLILVLLIGAIYVIGERTQSRVIVCLCIFVSLFIAYFVLNFAEGYIMDLHSRVYFKE